MKIFETRMQQKHDIPTNWEKSNLVPLAGEIIVYDSYYTNSELNRVIVAPTVRFKIGDGVTPVKDLPFSDSIELSSEVSELAQQVSHLTALNSSGLSAVDGTIVLTNTADGGKTIGVAISPRADNALVAIDGGLFVPTSKGAEYSAGDGIEIADSKISVKLADVTHGLTAVDGALTLNLATKDSGGAMSKEDKAFIDSIPELLANYATAQEVVDMKNALERYTLWGEM